MSDGIFPVDVLVQSPAETTTDLQVICLFRSDSANVLHGSLLEIDQKLGGLLSEIRKESLFSGALGETLLIAPRGGTVGAQRVLVIGLGDVEGFSASREQLVGSIVFVEAERLGIAHPFFAPTVLDGGKTGIDTGEAAEQFMLGFLRAKATGDLVRGAGMAAGKGLERLTFLAGATHAEAVREGLQRVVAAAAANKRMG